MMLLKDLIKEYKGRTGLNNEAIAKMVGVSRSTVGRWLSGDITNLQLETTRRLNEVLGIDIDKMMSDHTFARQKPLLGEVKAGYDRYLDNNIQGYIEVNEEDDVRGDYFLRVKGDSMDLARIHDGDIVFIKSCDHLRSGSIGIVMVGEEVTIKRVIIKDDLLILEAANPAYDNRYFTKKEVAELPIRILGQVIYAKSEFI